MKSIKMMRLGAKRVGFFGFSVVQRANANVKAVGIATQMLLANEPNVSNVRYFSKGMKKGGRSPHIQHHHHPGDQEEHEHADLNEAVSVDKTKKNMNGAILNFTRALGRMRPGRADAGVFDSLYVAAYGQTVPLAQVAQVSVSGAHSLSVNVYDPSVSISRTCTTSIGIIHGFTGNC
jgi:hypothetical protein